MWVVVLAGVLAAATILELAGLELDVLVLLVLDTAPLPEAKVLFGEQSLDPAYRTYY